MKWKPINTVGYKEAIIVAQISDAGIEQLSWLNDGFPLGSGACGWTHWCEQPEIPHPAESWPVDAKVFIGFNPDCLIHKMTDYSEPLVHLKQQIKLLEDGLSQGIDTKRLCEIMSFISDNCYELKAYIRSLEK